MENVQHTLFRWRWGVGLLAGALSGLVSLYITQYVLFYVLDFFLQAGNLTVAILGTIAWLFISVVVCGILTGGIIRTLAHRVNLETRHIILFGIIYCLTTSIITLLIFSGLDVFLQEILLTTDFAGPAVFIGAITGLLLVRHVHRPATQ